MASAATSRVPVAALRGPNRSALQARKGYGRYASGYCWRPYTNQVSNEIIVPATSPAAHNAASPARQKFSRTEDGAAQVMMAGVTTSAASALGTHHSTRFGKISSGGI